MMNIQPLSPWNGLTQRTRQRLIWSLWFATWTGLPAGLLDPWFYHYVVVFSLIHAAIVLYFTTVSHGRFSGSGAACLCRLGCGWNLRSLYGFLDADHDHWAGQ
jgi:hypothetical protein